MCVVVAETLLQLIIQVLTGQARFLFKTMPVTIIVNPFVVKVSDESLNRFDTVHLPLITFWS